MQKEDDMNRPDLVDVAELAKYLNVKKSWIYERTRKNEIPHVRVGKYVRFDPGEVIQFLESKQR